MGKRFGRNQKRKMRDEIALRDRTIDGLQFDLKHSRKSEHETSVRCDQLSRRLHTWASDVMQLMGEDSAFNERVKRFSSDFDGDIMRIAPFDRLQPVAFRQGEIPTTSVYTVIEALIWRLNVSRDEFTGHVRIMLTNRHGDPVGYALPRDHRWTDRDAEQIARMMVAAMKGHH